MKPLNKINLVVGFDQREAVAYHVFCQSIIDRATMPVQFLPLADYLMQQKVLHRNPNYGVPLFHLCLFLLIFFTLLLLN